MKKHTEKPPKIAKRPFFAAPRGVVLLCLVLAAVTLAAIRVGSAKMSNAEFFGGLFAKSGYASAARIIRYVRLPRALGALIAGVGLSLSGLLLQSITANDLAAPNIIGVNSGAGFAVILLISIAPQAVLFTPFAAFIGAFCTTLLILFVSGRRAFAGYIILAGIAVSTLLNAGISFISLLDSDVLASYNYFSVGGLSGVTMKKLAVPALLISVCLVISLLLARRINILTLGDDIAASLGVRVRMLRVLCVVLASACAACVVSFAGLLGFVGLVVPHIARRLCKSGSVYLLPTTALLGGILVVLADILGRTLIAPSEIPVGIITAFVGAPFFFILLLRRKKHGRI